MRLDRVVVPDSSMQRFHPMDWRGHFQLLFVSFRRLRGSCQLMVEPGRFLFRHMGLDGVFVEVVHGPLHVVQQQ